MLIDNAKYIYYGMTPEMIQCVKSACSEFSNHSLTEVLEYISNDSRFTQPERNIIIFEIGRMYGKR